MAFSWGDWAKSKADIALALNEGGCGCGYSEAALILCAAISAMAAEAWPGRGIDKKRFVEVLIHFAKATDLPATISVPLLIESLEQKREREVLKKTFLNFSYGRILLGPDVDQSESVIRDICPSLTPEKLRPFSYANLLYKLIRSAYAHEYMPDKNACPFPMTKDESVGVSYVNRLISLEPHAGYRHLIYFHTSWLSNLVSDLGQTIDAQNLSFPLTTPTKWWVEG
ncbi:MAG: hypothetical protein KQH53_12650 [Desulfarculaceae bacterium]|nr:hypothetical protein [Desulfarculaceae bacterium]